MASSESERIPTEEINEFLEAMKKKDSESHSEEELQKAFLVLRKDKDTADVPVDVLRQAVENLGLTKEDVEETVLHVKSKDKSDEQTRINSEEFIEIIKLLEEPSVVDQFKKIQGIVKRKKMVVLYGESGVGKTWMARKIAAHALRKGEFDVAIWVYMNRTYSENLSLQKSIAYQLSVLADFEESEAEEAKKKEELEKDKTKQDKPVETKENTKQEKIEWMIHEALKTSMKHEEQKKKEKKVLLILDDEGSNLKLKPQDEKDTENRLLLVKKETEEDVQGDLGKILGLDKLESDQILINILITTRVQPHPSRIGIKLRRLTQKESDSLVLHEMDSVGKSKGEIKDLADFFIGKSRRLPAEVLIIAKVVSYIADLKSGLQKLRTYKEILEKGTDLKVEDILIRGYERIPISVLIDLYSSETRKGHFLHRGGMVDFNELISFWIMEGHLGHFDRIEDAYEEGHRVLMELINCGLLQKQEADYVTPSEARCHLDILDRHVFFRRIHTGLAVAFDMKLGKVALADGMIRTVSSSGQERITQSSSSDQEGMKLLTLLLDGNRIGQQLPSNDSLSELEVLAIFNPTRQHFQLPILKMKRLRLLVLRGCQFLESIEHNSQGTIDQQHTQVLEKSKSFPLTQKSSLNPSSCLRFFSENLGKLTVLEISGPSSLKEIPDDLFQEMPNIRTLNMSYLHQIELLPKSFYHLTKIEFLILRGCSSLRQLGTLENLKDLQVLDISGATSFEKFQDKSLKQNVKLQILNLSQTRVITLPFINPCKDLIFISLRDCAVLQRIRMISRLVNLQVFDISGAAKVDAFCDPSLEDLKSLEILDVSCTAIRRLPSNICNPRYLYLKDCSRIKRVSPVEGLVKVEVLDLSGSCHLEEISSGFFKDLKDLRELNLSKTKVKHLPFLSSLGNLRRLLLSQCQNLEKLENLSSLEKLEFLDLSGCSVLKEIEDESFQNMNHLHYLDVSGIQLNQFPSLSKLVMLKELHVKDCPNLTELSGIEELPRLEFLDHSGTNLKPIPSFINPDRPRFVRVLGAGIDNIDHQQLMKKLGATIAEANSDESKSTDLPREDHLMQCKWSISNWPGEVAINEETLGEAVHGVHFLQLLKKYPSLLTNNFSRFHFLVYPSEELPDKFSYRSELSLRDIYFEQVSQHKLERCLEIREFTDSPPFLGYLLKQAEFVVLVDNPFFRSLLNLSGVEDIMAIKAYWIESCNELEHVIACEKAEDSDKPGESAESKGDPAKNFADIFKNLEILWVSDAMNLKTISNGDVQSISFKSLKSLYLEYCPQISMICSSFLQLESLEILHVKYCQNLKTFFTDDDSANLEKLIELHMWGLEELEKIAFKVPSLRTLRVGECPLLEHVINASSQGHEDHEVDGHEILEIIHIKFCDKLKTIYESSNEDKPYFSRLQELELSALPGLKKIECEAPSLNSLKVVECPSLQHIVCSVPEELKILEVKYCDELKKVFFKDGGLDLEKIEKMELLGLPEVDNINGASSLPSVNKDSCIIWGCPKLQDPIPGQTMYNQIMQEIHPSSQNYIHS